MAKNAAKQVLQAKMKRLLEAESPRELAHTLGVHERTIINWTQGRVLPQQHSQRRIDEALIKSFNKERTFFALHAPALLLSLLGLAIVLGAYLHNNTTLQLF